MEEEKNNMQELGEKIVQYAETRIEHTKLSFTFAAIRLSSNILTVLLLAMIFFIFYFCFICGISLLIGSILQNTASGFFVITGIHFILFVIIFFFRVSVIENPFREKLTKTIFKSSK
jgi:hypothetical protein